MASKNIKRGAMMASLILSGLLQATCLAIDAKSVMPMIVHVVDSNGEAIEGAAVTLTGTDLSKVPTKLTNKEAEILTKASLTDRLGYALAYYYGGSTVEKDQFSCSLPPFVNIEKTGFKPIHLSMKSRGALTVRPSETVSLIVEVIMTRKQK